MLTLEQARAMLELMGAPETETITAEQMLEIAETIIARGVQLKQAALGALQPRDGGDQQ